jgi:hypothetical protein
LPLNKEGKRFGLSHDKIRMKTKEKVLICGFSSGVVPHLVM